MKVAWLVEHFALTNSALLITDPITPAVWNHILIQPNVPFMTNMEQQWLNKGFFFVLMEVVGVGKGYHLHSHAYSRA